VKLALRAVLAAAALACASHAASARADWLDCIPLQVTNDDDAKVAVRCVTPVIIGGQPIEAFAISSRDPVLADRFVTLATAALLSGSAFMVDVLISPVLNVPGCLAENCRTPKSFGVKRR